MTERQGDDAARERARTESDLRAKASRDRQAEALRANLKRRKAQARGRTEADRAPPAD